MKRTLATIAIALLAGTGCASLDGGRGPNGLCDPGEPCQTTTTTCEEDMACWDAETMGNGVAGPDWDCETMGDKVCQNG